MDSAISNQALAETESLSVQFDSVLDSIKSNFDAQPDYRKRTLIKAMEHWSERVFRPLDYYKPNKD